jgi:hypothetical protein
LALNSGTFAPQALLVMLSNSLYPTELLTASRVREPLIGGASLVIARRRRTSEAA